MNLYGYVGNDPVNYTDPTGLSSDGCSNSASHCVESKQIVSDAHTYFEGSDEANSYLADFQGDSQNTELTYIEHLGEPTGRTRNLFVRYDEVDRYEGILEGALETGTGVRVPKNAKEGKKAFGRALGPMAGNLIGDVHFVDTVRVYQPQAEYNAQRVYFDYNAATGVSSDFLWIDNVTIWRNTGPQQQQVIDSRIEGTRWWFRK